MQGDEKQYLTAVRSGVSGYQLSDAPASEVFSAFRAIARGKAVCPPRLRLALLRLVARASKETLTQIKTGSVHGLTMRQQQPISFVARGLTNKDIASQLNLSEFTVKNHLHRIMLRCGHIVAALRSRASKRSKKSGTGSVRAAFTATKHAGAVENPVAGKRNRAPKDQHLRAVSSRLRKSRTLYLQPKVGGTTDAIPCVSSSS